MTSTIQPVHMSIKRVFLMLFMLGIAGTAAALRQLAAAGILPNDAQGDGMLWFLIGQFDFLLVSGLMLIAFAVAEMICTRRLPLAAICGAIGIVLLAAGFLNKVPCDGASQLGMASCMLSGIPVEVGASASPADVTFSDGSDRGRQVAAVFMFFVGGVAMLLAIRFWRKAHQSLAWPTVRGQMTASKVIVYTRTASKGRQWRFHLEYQYAVDGHLYTGRNAYFGSDPTRAFARELVARFPVGSEVAVYHHPSQHATSVLVPGPNRHTYLAFLTGLVFLLFALVFWMGRLDG